MVEVVVLAVFPKEIELTFEVRGMLELSIGRKT